MSWWSLRFFRPAPWAGVRERRAGGRSAGRAGETRPAAPGPAWRWAGLAGVLLLALHVLLFPPLPRVEVDYPREGEIAPRELRAPLDFAAPLPPRDVELRRLERVLAEPPVLRRLPAEGAGAQPLERFQAWRQAYLAQRARNQAGPEEQATLLALRFPGLPEEPLRLALSHPRPEQLLAAIRAALVEVLEGGVADLLPPGNYARVRIVTAATETSVDVSTVTPQGQLADRLALALRGQGLDAETASWGSLLARHFAASNLVYDAAETRLRQDAARQAVPAARDYIKGERIIDQGMRVTEVEALALAQLRELLVQQGGALGRGPRLLRLATRALLVATALLLYAWAGRLHFAPVLRRPRHIAAIAAMVGLFLGAAAFSLGRPQLGVFAVPVPLLALLATVMFRGAVGHATTLLGIALLAVLPGLAASAVFVWVILGEVTVAAVRRIQQRSQFYQTIALLCGLTVLLITVVRLAEGAAPAGLGREYLAGLLTPVVAVAFALFLLPIVEPLVGVSSDLTLLELSDLNHPLLKRMALESQGTYHHSQVVSQLAEQAARAIGANALLTRVGALFHDIGKLAKSEYFVENQGGGPNKHDELTPSMSALVVAAHVKDGIELGRKWRLPQAVIDFIPEHHGTSVMEFFYHKALESDPSSTVKVDDFRYPGPKPRSRETAILMLADAVEAAVRSLAKPTPSRIRETTKQIIDKRMLSGELDESQLTLSDLAKVREAFIPLLSGIHHARILYPGQREDRPKPPEPGRARERGQGRAGEERRADA